MRSPVVNIGAIISFCSYDYRFLKAALDGVQPFAKERIVVVCDHFFDGKEEEYALLEAAYAAHPDVRFIEYPFHPEKPYGFSTLYPGHPDWIHHWHNTSRYAGFLSLSEACDYVLFLDADEILEGEQLCKMVLHGETLRFQGYYYFREARFRAVTHAPYGLLMPVEKLRSEALFDEDERRGVYLRHGGDPEAAVQGDEPYLHHFSWVRTQEEILRKVQSWGHAHERDWVKIFSEELSAPFSMKDCVRGYSYEEVTPIFDPLHVIVPELPRVSLQDHLLNIKKMAHVQRVDERELFRRALMKEILCSQIPTSI